MVRFLRDSRSAKTDPRAGCRRPKVTPTRHFLKFGSIVLLVDER